MPGWFSHTRARVAFLLGGALAALCLYAILGSGCAPQSSSGDLDGRSPESSLELTYADQFGADFYDDGTTLVTIADGQRLLLVPEGATVPTGLNEDIIVVQEPLDDLYVAASASMDSFVQLGALEDVKFTSTTAENWSIPEVKDALADGTLTYVGKYSAPDFELLVDAGTDLALESTMIFHSPDIQEQLESLGIPVVVERSSYESDPLGRLEWIKFFGLLTGRLDEAEALFDESMATLKPILSAEQDGQERPTVAFFSIASNGNVVVRKPGDYVTRMIEMAGGDYMLDAIETDDTNLSTMNMQMEAFYEQARDADILIYNSTIDGELATLDDFLAKSEMLQDFKAVQTGNVWGTGKNLYQQTSDLATLITDFHQVMTNEPDEVGELTYLHRLR